MNQFDNKQAYAEGWALFNDGVLHRLDNGRINEAHPDGDGRPAFTSDHAALAFVRQRAAKGSNYHIRALQQVQSSWYTAMEMAAQLDLVTRAAREVCRHHTNVMEFAGRQYQVVPADRLAALRKLLPMEG